jgi:SAM-dependent methyltransferase
MGQFLVHAKRRGWAVYGEDSNTNIPAFLRKHFNIPCYSSLGQIQPGSFSVVRAAHVLEHIAQPVNFIEEAGRILKKDGLFMITVPSGESLSGAFVNFLRRFASRTPRLMISLKPNFHVSGFSIRSLTSLLLSHNFSPVKVFTVSMGNRTYYPFFYDGLIKIKKPSFKEFLRSWRYYLPLLIDNIGNPFGLGFEVVGYFRKNS